MGCFITLPAGAAVVVVVGAAVAVVVAVGAAVSVVAGAGVAVGAAVAVGLESAGRFWTTQPMNTTARVPRIATLEKALDFMKNLPCGATGAYRKPRGVARFDVPGRESKH